MIYAVTMSTFQANYLYIALSYYILVYIKLFVPAVSRKEFGEKRIYTFILSSRTPTVIPIEIYPYFENFSTVKVVLKPILKTLR